MTWRRQMVCGVRASSMLVALSLACAWAGEAASDQPLKGQKVLLLAAASTTDAVTELAETFGKRTGATVRVSTGSSGALSQQILAGAPADIFLSANEKWADAVVRTGESLEIRALLSNEIVIVTPKGNPAQIHGPGNLLKQGVKHVALASETAPAGIYAEQSLRSTNVFDTLAADGRIVRGQDVRFTLSYVETGEAEAGVVYATDARASESVEVVYIFAPATHKQIVYPVLLLKHAEENPAARQFFEFLAGEEGMEVFLAYGFSHHPGPRPDDSEKEDDAAKDGDR